MKGAYRMLKQNEGSTDRIIRVFVGIGLVATGLFWSTGVMQIIAYGIGAVALITGVLGFCELYAVFGISTMPAKRK